MEEIKVTDKSSILVSSYTLPDSTQIITIGKQFRAGKKKIITKAVGLDLQYVDDVVSAIQKIKKQILKKQKIQNAQKDNDTKQISGLSSETIKFLWTMREKLTEEDYERLLKKLIEATS